MIKLSKVMTSVLAVAMALQVVLSGCAADTVAQNTYEKARITARTEIWKDINSGKAGSATVAIMENGKIVYSEGFGMADREKSIPVDHKTLLNIGSISKVYVATAIMLLVDDGKVKLDAPVTQYLPDFTMLDPRYKDITVRMLLNHTGGFPGGTMANSFGYDNNADTFSDTLKNLSRSYLKHAPGAMSPYCNEGFTLAEIIVERVSGKKYIDFLSERVFEPLSLNNTGLSVGEESDKTCAAYYRVSTAQREPLEVVSVLGAGGLAATAEDLCRFMDTFSGEGKQIFSKSSLEEMKKGQPALFAGKLRSPDMPYGLGWDMTDLPRYQARGIQVLGKSGGTGNYTSMVYTVPAQRLSVAVICTGSGSSAMTMALDILDAVLVEKGLIQEEKAAVTKPLEHQAMPPEDTRYSGYYSTGDNIVRISFNTENNTVTGNTLKYGVETPTLSLFYNNGYYVNPSGSRSYFITIDGKDYLVGNQSKYGLDMVAVQKLAEQENPQKLRIDIDGKQWLRRNVKPFEAAMLNIAHVVKSGTIEELPGYVDFYGPKIVKSPDFAGMPVNNLRDLTELTLFDKEGRTWAYLSDFLFSPAELAGTIKPGDNSVKIGDSGYNEWLKADEGLILSFVKPDNGRIIAFSPDGTAIYDSAVDKGDMYIPQGGFVELVGTVGDIFRVTAGDNAK
ncbi:MAG: serine hydrolase [Dehalococcoidales bacterium]|nr:serine hydrolase [Dehalococcoidales bacterium]